MDDTDVVVVLREQHDRIRELFHRLAERDDPAGCSDLHRLRVLVAAHETVEQELVRPELIPALGSWQVERTTLAERDLVRDLDGLDGLRGATATDALERLWSALLSHLEDEEQHELTALLSTVPCERRRALGRAAHVVDDVVRDVLGRAEPVSSADVLRTTRDALARSAGAQGVKTTLQTPSDLRWNRS